MPEHPHASACRVRHEKWDGTVESHALVQFVFKHVEIVESIRISFVSIDKIYIYRYLFKRFTSFLSG